MKYVLLISLLFLAFQIGNENYAQGEAAIPVLELNPSPKFDAMGMVGTSIPNNDPFGFYYNPAQLGYNSQSNNISFQFFPSKVNWLGFNNVSYNNTAFNIGFNFKKWLDDLSLSVGFGYIHSKMDYGTFIMTGPDSPTPIGTFTSYDEFNVYGFGLGVEYNYIKFNIGITYKNINSVLTSQPSVDIAGKGKAKISAMDYGFLIAAPIVKLINPKYKLFSYYDMNAIPYLNVSIGYARLNQGGEVYYIDPSQADPLPRTARLGYTFSTGFNIHFNNVSIRMLGYNFSAEADDILIDRNIVSYSYQSGLGDINIQKNLIELRGDEKVTVHKGHCFSFFDTFSYMIGRFDGHGYYNQKSSGFGLRARGVLQLIKTAVDSQVYNYIADHIDIQYYSTMIFENAFGQTRLEGLGLTFSGFFF
jgi:hypothetical protein